MTNMYYRTASGEQYLIHHGILGQRWGIRRFQNKDGSLTAAGKKRQARLEEKAKKKDAKKKEKLQNRQAKAAAKAKAAADKAALEKQRHDDSLEGLLAKGNKMSNAELNKAIARMDLEVKYRQAVEKYKAPEVAARQARQAKIDGIKQKVGESAGKVAANAAKNLIATVAAKGINTLFGQEIVTKKELLTGQLEDKKKKEEPKNTKLESITDLSKLNDNQVKDALTRANQQAQLKKKLSELGYGIDSGSTTDSKDKKTSKTEKSTDVSYDAPKIKKNQPVEDLGDSSDYDLEKLKRQLNLLAHGEEIEDDDEYAGDPVFIDYEDFEDTDDETTEFKEAEFFVSLMCRGE